MFCEDKKCPVYIECMERLEALPYCASKATELATTDRQQLKSAIDLVRQHSGVLHEAGAYSLNSLLDVIERVTQKQQ